MMSSMTGGGRGGSLLPLWTTHLFLLLLCCPLLLTTALPDEESVGESYVTGGGIFLVLVFNAIVLMLIMLIYYYLISTDKIFLRGTDELEASGLLLPKEKGSWVGGEASDDLDPSSLSFPSEWKNKDNPFSRFFSFWGSWWQAVILTPQETIIENAGFDGAAYLQMQKGMIVLFGFLSLFCLIVLLPVYETVDQPYEVSGFSSITAENIPSENSRLWAVMVGEFLLIVGFLMYLYRFSLFYLEKPTNLSRFGTSVMVQGINRDVVDSTRLERHVQRMFPGTKVTATIIPDFNEFASLMEEKKMYTKRISKYRKEFEETSERPTLCPLDSLRYYSVGDDAIDFFEEKLAATETKIEYVCSQPLRGSGTGFVSFKNLEGRNHFLDVGGNEMLQAEQAETAVAKLEEEMRQTRGTRSTMRRTTVIDVPEWNNAIHSDFLAECSTLQTNNWILWKAVHPSLVMWESLSVTAQEKMARRVSYTLILFLVLLFFTTPIAILGGLNELLIAIGIEVDTAHGGITSFIPSLLLLLLTIAIPPALEASSTLAKYNTKATHESASMIWIFVFLFLSTFLLPTFMLTTLAALAVFLTDSSLEQLGGLIFPNSAFFVAFMIQAAFLGNGVELLLPGDLARRVFSSNTTTGLPVFHFGLGYAYFLTYFSIGLFYSVLVPIMAPATFAFLVLRHIVDKYNLLYRCKKGTDGLLDTYFLRSLVSINYVAALTTTFGIFLYMVSKSGGVVLCGVTVAYFCLIGGIWIYLILVVWSRKSGTSHYDQEEREVNLENVQYVHPVAVEYADRGIV